MKVGTRKITMRKPPDCEERNRLRTESTVLLSEWLRCKDELRMTSKNDSSYQRKVLEVKDAHKRHKKCNALAAQHVREHGCW